MKDSDKVLEIKRSASNKYKELLQEQTSIVLLSSKSSFFPWYFKGNVKKSDSFDEAIDLYKQLYSSSKEKIGYGYEIETREVNTRLYGKQTVIEGVSITTLEDYLKFIGKVAEFNEFSIGLKTLEDYFVDNSYSLETLYEWVVSHLDFLQEKKADDYYASLFLAFDWLVKHPNSGLYIREIPIEVHTKFIEENEKIIASLYMGIKNFETMLPFEDIFGLKKKEPLIRFRCKDDRNEMALPVSSFISLDTDEDLSNIGKVYIVENEIVYLTFPLHKNSMCIFGSGFRVSILSSSPWLKNKKLYYFGDLDEHGFEMLGMFRSFFSHTKSFLMDKQTYLNHFQYVVSGNVAPKSYESYLTAEEKEMLEMLRSNPKKNRLEQERISVRYIEQALNAKAD